MARPSRSNKGNRLRHKNRPGEPAQCSLRVVFCDHKELVARGEIDHARGVPAKRALAHVNRRRSRLIHAVKTSERATEPEIDIFVICPEPRIKQPNAVKDLLPEQGGGHRGKCDAPASVPRLRCRVAVVSTTPCMTPAADQIP
jgi:hypothetical protein